MKRIGWIFPGQGSQYVGMGRSFFEEYAIARDTLSEAEDRLHRPLKKMMLEGSAEQLALTANSQIAIYVMSMAICRTIKQLFPELVPMSAAGLSLGEYSALTAANAISFKEGVVLVQKRALFMQMACERYAGGMEVIVGLSPEEVVQMVREMFLPQDLWVANLNCPDQVVISGTKRGLELGKQEALKRGARRVVPLNVQGAFHSGLMRDAETELSKELGNVTIKEGDFPIYMNVTGKEAKTVEEISSNLTQQVSHPVYWQKSVQAMDCELFIEMGPGKTLAGIGKKIDNRAVISVEETSQLKEVEKECLG